MPDAASEAIETFRQVAAALEDRDWQGAAALCDPVSLRIFHRQLLDQFAPRTRNELTVDDFRRHQPDMPIEVVEYQLNQFRRQQAERLSRIDGEVARVASLEELAELDPSEAFARWLEAHDPRTQLRRLVAQHPEVAGLREAGVTGLPMDRMEALGAVVVEPFAHVLYRRSWAASDGAAQAHWDEALQPYSEEERAWLRQPGVGLVQVATLRRQPDRSWRFPADHSFLQGTTWFAQHHMQAFSQDERGQAASRRLLTLNRRVRQVLLAVIGLLLLWLAWIGLTGGASQLPQSQTLGQIAQTLTQFGFGLFAFLSLVTTFWARRWNPLMLVGWTISVTLAGGLASVVWGGTSLLVGVLSGAAALVIGLGIAWLLRVAARGLPHA